MQLVGGESEHGVDLVRLMPFFLLYRPIPGTGGGKASSGLHPAQFVVQVGNDPALAS